MKLISDLIKKITDNEIWKSVFRHGYTDTPRNRVLQIISNVWLHLHPAKVREHGTKIRFTWCMGGITFFLFLFETITGILLMFYYVPDVNRAYADMVDLMYVVPFGRFLRNSHRWGAHAMVITVSIHMLRVFLTGSYKPPRQFNWVIGVTLLVLTLLLSFTGYLLPWDQLGYWAITVGTNMARATPFLGQEGTIFVHTGNESRQRYPFCIARRNNNRRSCIIACVCLALYSNTCDSFCIDDAAFLENS